MRSVLVLGSAAALAAAPALAIQPGYQLTIFDPLPGQPSTYPAAMNEAGQIVGIAASDRFDPGGVPIMTTAGVLTPLPVLPDTSFNFPIAMNDSGLVVGVSQLAAARYNAPPGFLTPAPGYFNGFAYGVNDVGRVSGSQINDLFGLELPAWWPSPDAEGRFLRTFEENQQGAGFGVNAAGQIVGWLATIDGARAVRWDDPNQTPGLIRILAGGDLSEFVDVNSHGDACGRTSFADFTTRAMLHEEFSGELFDLGDLGGTYNYAHSLNDNRWVVGEANTSDMQLRAFLWIDGTMYDLNDLVQSANQPYLALVSAVEVNNAGQVAVAVQLDTPDAQQRIGLLTPIDPCRGDADGDQDVDLDDLLLVLGNFGCQADCVLGDVDADTDVDLDDLLLVLGRFGSSCEA